MLDIVFPPKLDTAVPTSLWIGIPALSVSYHATTAWASIIESCNKQKNKNDYTQGLS